MAFLAATAFLTPCNNNHHQLPGSTYCSFLHSTGRAERKNPLSYTLYLIKVIMTILKLGKKTKNKTRVGSVPLLTMLFIEPC